LTTAGLTAAATSAIASFVFERIGIASLSILGCSEYAFEFIFGLDEMPSPSIDPIIEKKFAFNNFRHNSDFIEKIFYVIMSLSDLAF
jgi:hypothetical protein